MGILPGEILVRGLRLGESGLGWSMGHCLLIFVQKDLVSGDFILEHRQVSTFFPMGKGCCGAMPYSYVYTISYPSGKDIIKRVESPLFKGIAIPGLEYQ